MALSSPISAWLLMRGQQSDLNVRGAWGLLRESVELILSAVPAGIGANAVADFLRAQPGVTGVHDLHIWAMSTTESALTAHLVVPGGHPGDAVLDGLVGRLACASPHSARVYFKRYAAWHATQVCIICPSRSRALRTSPVAVASCATTANSPACRCRRAPSWRMPGGM
jgi:hypothetical protein